MLDAADDAAEAYRRAGPSLIGDYGFLSDCTSAALVDREGTVDWWCVPRFDSPSVSGRLLDPAAGHWALAPVGAFESWRQYVEDSLVLRTVFRTGTGQAEVTAPRVAEHGEPTAAGPGGPRCRARTAIRRRGRRAKADVPVVLTSS